MGAAGRGAALASKIGSACVVLRTRIYDANGGLSVFLKMRGFSQRRSMPTHRGDCVTPWRLPPKLLKHDLRSFRTSASVWGAPRNNELNGDVANTPNPPPHPPNGQKPLVRHNADPESVTIDPVDAALQSKRDVADTLKIIKVVRAVRTRGHLSARLDPLGRSLGPLIEGYESMETSVPDGGADIARLMNGYPDKLYLRGRKVNPGQFLGLHDTRPHREFFFGDELLTLSSDKVKKQWWSLDEILKKLRGAYCGTLSAEFEHLNSTAKKKWMRGRLEGHARDFFEGTSVASSASAEKKPTVASSGALDDEFDDPEERNSLDKNINDTKWQSGGPVDGVRRLEGLWLDGNEKRSILKRVLTAERLELFLGKHFPSAKRFGLEGAESLIPGLQALVETCGANGVTQIVVGMAHRGRLNILSNVFDKPLALICAEMRSEGRSDFNVGDVRYHLGARSVVSVPFGEEELDEQGNKEMKKTAIEMTMAPNPSHLEAVNCVATGMVRSKQVRVDPNAGKLTTFASGGIGKNTQASHTTSSSSRTKVVGLLLHGDAAFCGLGANAETMQLQDLPEYTTGGTIQVIVNNQIGFTTVPRRARSSPHPSDVAKGYGAPIFHVNGDDPEAVVRAFRLAAEYRSHWKSDVVVNFICYRRLGHNEQDDPSITLPLRAAAIANQPRVGETYGSRLIRENVCSQHEIDQWVEEIDTGFNTELQKSSTHVESAEDWAVSAWHKPTGQRDCDVVGGESFGDQNVGDSMGKQSQDVNLTGGGAAFGQFIVEDGDGGPQARPRHKPTLTTTPINVQEFESPAVEFNKNKNKKQNPRAVTTGVPLPLLRALGMAVTELPEERLEEVMDDSDDENDDSYDDDDDSDDDSDSDFISARRRAAIEARLIAVPQKTLFPQNFVPHPHVRKLLQNRRAMVASPEQGTGEVDKAGMHATQSQQPAPGVDWGTAELLAFGSLLLQTDNDKFHCHVRLSGQDVERGTFNHRHAVLYCSKTSVGVNPLDNLGLGRQDRFVVSNSPLSEHAVLGFEYGYSVDSAHETLCVWEAQFGDFANNAQCIVDQFISSGEAKWGQRSGIVLLLPHGHDGQGPDHSSARPERWLAAANDDPDTTPGRAPQDILLAKRTYEALTGEDELLDLEKFRERVEALEHESVGDSNSDVSSSSSDDLFISFDEEGGLIVEEDDLARVPREFLSGCLPIRVARNAENSSQTDTTDSNDSSQMSQRTRRKAQATRQMLHDVTSFFNRETGYVDQDLWSKYMRHRARQQNDTSANFIIISPSTPAQYFHALRRQALAPHRKPMVVLAPKYLLHHRPCVSNLGDFGPQTRFRTVIGDGDRGDNLNINGSTTTSDKESGNNPHRRVIICTGKTYYVLAHARKTRKMENEVAMVRLEQLFPFPHEALAKRLNRYGGDTEIVWAQEEPKNMGFWGFVQPRVETALRELVGGNVVGGDGDEGHKVPRKVRYVGRPASASPASGSQTIHARETKAFVDEALG